ncbi:hypothetical protein, partial [uncultured Campylobacter sp.]|uniref:hypothetical protein n=1 Tax=uncultured Campylobacter sp. TaxID=218934 RepID=UPI00260DF3AB
SLATKFRAVICSFINFKIWLEFCALMALYVQFVRKDVLNKRCANMRILTAAKRVNLLIKKHINLHKKAKFSSATKPSKI